MLAIQSSAMQPNFYITPRLLLCVSPLAPLLLICNCMGGNLVYICENCLPHLACTFSPPCTPLYNCFFLNLVSIQRLTIYMMTTTNKRRCKRAPGLRERKQKQLYSQKIFTAEKKLLTTQALLFELQLHILLHLLRLKMMEQSEEKRSDGLAVVIKEGMNGIRIGSTGKEKVGTFI